MRLDAIRHTTGPSKTQKQLAFVVNIREGWRSSKLMKECPSRRVASGRERRCVLHPQNKHTHTHTHTHTGIVRGALCVSGLRSTTQ